jgi:Cys-tRNA(Pro)/Cys-tRNA(Cys) deacylase
VSRSDSRIPATPATRALDTARIAWTGHAYHHDPTASSYGLEAATALGAPPERVFKTLLVEGDGELLVAVIPVSRRLDLGAFARAVGAKRAALAEPSVAERRTGYVVGGISPLGQKHRHRTVLDASATAHRTIFVSGGRRGFDVQLAPAELLSLTEGSIAPIATA